MALRIPAATYRLQFNRKFSFADARALAPYLQALGISDLYASPLFAARPGSPHGYDVTDPTRLNPELGGAEVFTALAGTLQELGMGLLLDIVPNHMVASRENPWWWDVLQNGPDSPYAAYFDIDWQPVRPGLKGRVLVPVLGAPYGKVLEEGELTLSLTAEGFLVGYHEWRFPLNAEAHRAILEYQKEALTGALGVEHPAVRQLTELSEALVKITNHKKKQEDLAAFRRVRERLWQLTHTFPEVKTLITQNLQRLSGRKGETGSFTFLERILEVQSYRLACWRVAKEEINYRRFFDVSELVSLRQEDEDVFLATHALILQLAAAGQVTGLRVDHVDGLQDPRTYLSRLQERLPAAKDWSPGFYVVVEKILSNGEELPADWPVSGTTGYDFLNAVNGLFVDGRGAVALDEIYYRASGCPADFAGVAYQQKERVMKELFASEVRNLGWQLGQLAEQDRFGRDLTLRELEEALVTVTACLPVYRTYIRDFTVAARDRMYLERAVAEAVLRRPAAGPAVAFLRRVLLLDFPDYLPAELRPAWLRFVMRWQQFTGPVMAKGFEDTALYVYNRFIALNEVGGDPGTTGVPVAEFHRRNRRRQEYWPHTLNATSTHDTKRSEDVRERLNVLSEIPAAWSVRLNRWRRWNRPKKPVVKGRSVPDGNTEIFLYQTLLGAWPLREEEVPAFRKRLLAYLVKAAREAKIETSWLNPDAAYEDALKEFATVIFEPGQENFFLEDFRQFQRFIAYYGALNSLAQTLLKIASPGVPDFYQGTELWNFSLVDPDNRRPVDFRIRAAMLTELQRQEAGGLPALARELLACWPDGRIKLYVIYKALHFRKSKQELFATGEYIPLAIAGREQEHVCAFARRLGDAWAVVAVPRLVVRLLREKQLLPEKLATGELPVGEPGEPAPRGAKAAIKPGPEGTPAGCAGDLSIPGRRETDVVPLGGAVWGESVLLLPIQAPGRWLNIFTGEKMTALETTAVSGGSHVLPLARVFHSFPVALLVPPENFA